LEGPPPIAEAPRRGSIPLPGSFQLRVDPSTRRVDGGAVLLGGSPLRLLRLSPRAQALLEQWNHGAPVGDGPAARLLARRLVSSGTFVPIPDRPDLGLEDVTVVIPVKDRPACLERLLESLGGLSCVVVDDASSEPALTKEIAARHRVQFVGLDVNLGPAAARNAGLAVATSPLVAFIDSDCLPPAGWLEPLLGYFNDPVVAAVAPRIVPLSTFTSTSTSTSTRLTRYESVRSSLDRGPDQALVRPLSKISYVPSAALVVRREVAGAELFDARLRGGEDVDLVWRLVDAGWDVRYVPAVAVAHQGPASLASWLSRRYFYGTTAAPLSTRHPDNLAPLYVSAWSAAVWFLAWLRKPELALGALVMSILLLARRLTRTVADPVKVATDIAGGGTIRSALPALAGLTRAWSPAMTVGLLSARTRKMTALALLAPAIHDWVANRGELDPASFVALHVADDLAYGTGVWMGCLRTRTVRPLVPRIAFRSRVWSAASLRTELAQNDTSSGEAP
jgi:mycofactocin system glycosyltransferase